MRSQALLEPLVGTMWTEVTTVLQDTCDALITTSPETYEPEGTAQLRKWMRGTGREAYTIGPLLPSPKHTREKAAEAQLSENAGEIEGFLDRVLSERGETSLLYVCFCFFL